MSSVASRVGAPGALLSGLWEPPHCTKRSARLSDWGPFSGAKLPARCCRKGLRVRNAHSSHDKSTGNALQNEGRRQILVALVAAAAAIAAQSERASADAAADGNKKFTDMPALRGKDYGKSAMRAGPDYVLTESGLQYKELKPGLGPQAQQGQTAVIDWDGFTIGYYGRIFEARNKAKGGSFEGSEKDFYRFRLGENKVIPAFEEAVAGMRVGSIRRIIVPPELGYPNNDYTKAGPKPQTFSGQRALDFVLKNQGLIDKTLLFDIELLKLED